MDETIDALSERLAPSHLMNEAMSWVRGGDSHGSRAADAAAIAKTVGSKAWEQMKRHPVSSALIGAGIAWMFFENGGGRQAARIRRHGQEPHMYGGSYVDARTGHPYTQAYGDEYAQESPSGPAATQKAGQAWEQAKGRASGAAESVQATMSSAAEEVRRRTERLSGQARDTASAARGRVRQGAEAVGAYVSGTAESAKHYVGETAGQVSHRVASGYEYSRDRLWQTVEDYPLAVGGAALGLGLVLGLAAPRTRREDEWIGQTSDQLKERARRSGREIVERGKHVAEATAAAVADEAQKQGLTPSGLAEHGRNLAAKVGEDVQEEGMTPGSLKDKVGAVAARATETAKHEVKGEAEEQEGA